MIICWCKGLCELFPNIDDVHKDGYSARCDKNDGNVGGWGRDIFVTLAMFSIASIFAGAKRSDGIIQVMMMGFYLIFSYL